MTQPNITVHGNVAGSIVVGDHNFVVNTNHGTIVYQQAVPQVRLRQVKPQPPRSPRHFVNRVQELAQIEKAITTREALAIYGEDGAGKSTLLRQAAAGEVAFQMPNGVVLLEGVDEDGNALGFEDVLQQLFDALHESQPPLKVNAAVARTYLSNTQPLVVLDNLNFSDKQLATLPDLLPLGALLRSAKAAPSPESVETGISLKELPRAEAIQLFALRTDATLSEGSKALVDAICDLLGDNPLAIVTAAGLARANNLALDRLRQALQNAKIASRDKTKAGLERAHALAYSLLTDSEQKALAVTSVANGISVDPKMLQLNEASVEKMKAMELLHANSPRLRIDPALRELARRSVDQNALKTQIILYLRDVLTAKPRDWELHRDELGNILGAIRWAVELGRWEDVIALGRGLDPYLTLHGLWDVWQATLASVLTAAQRGGQRAVEGWALHQLGTRDLGLGQSASARSLLNQALQIRKSLGDDTGAAFTQHNLNFLPAVPIIKPPAGPNLMTILVLGALGFAAVAIGLGIIGGIIFNNLTTPEPPVRVTQVTDTPVPIDTVTPTPRRVTAVPVLPTTPPPTADKTIPDLKIVSVNPDDKVISYGSCGPKTLTVRVYAFDASGVTVDATYIYLFASGKEANNKETVLKVTAVGNDFYEGTVVFGRDPLVALNASNGFIEIRFNALDKFKNVSEVSRRIPMAYCPG